MFFFFFFARYDAQQNVITIHGDAPHRHIQTRRLSTRVGYAYSRTYHEARAYTNSC